MINIKMSADLPNEKPFIEIGQNLPKIIKQKFYEINLCRTIPKEGKGYTNIIQTIMNPDFPFFWVKDFFIIRDYWMDLIKTLNEGVIYNENIVTELIEIEPCIKAYEKGWICGFNNFEEDKLKTTQSILKKSNSNIVSKIFDYVLNDSPFHKGMITWGRPQKGLLNICDIEISNNNCSYEGRLIEVYRNGKCNACKNLPVVDSIENLYKQGVKGGYYYRAWYEIITNYTEFENLFQECFKVKQRQQMNANYNLPIYFYQNYENYKYFKNECETHGFLQINTGKEKPLKVYNPALHIILTTKELTIQIDKDKFDCINGREFVESYEKGFFEGYEKTLNDYGNKLLITETHVKDIKENYFNIEHEGFLGYNSIRNQVPLIISDKIIKKFGYYAGVVTCIDELVNENPNLFEGFYKTLPPQPIKTKAEILKEQLSQYGFLELEKVSVLSEQSRASLIEKISEKGLPYAIAMFDYLKFIQYLERKHFDIKYKLHREVSKWFGSDNEGRAVKGNISSLLKNTTENKNRYTAYKHKENVINDYELLK